MGSDHLKMGLPLFQVGRPQVFPEENLELPFPALSIWDVKPLCHIGVSTYD